MPRNPQKLTIIKIPLKGSYTVNKPQTFPQMPRLYLELLENKSKIRQDLINKEYVPAPKIDPYSSPPPLHSPSPSQSKYKFSPELPTLTKKTLKSYNDTYDKQDKKFQNRLDLLLSDNNSSHSSNSIPSKPSVATNSSVSELSIYEKKMNPKPSVIENNIYYDKSKENPPPEPNQKQPSQNTKEVDNVSENSDNLSLRLKELLNDDSDTNNSLSADKSRKPIQDKYSKPRDKYGHSIDPTFSQVHPQHPPTSMPPTLAELEAKGGYIPRQELRDINQQPFFNEQQEDDAKRELLFKFDLLRKSYPVANIADYTIHTDLNTLEKSYTDCVRRLSLDSTVENYKTYLVYGFMGCEFILGNFLKFDMQGFTQQQIVSMQSYEKLLIELGEKSYIPSGSKWPVELRLLFMIIMNAGFFIVSKMIMKKTGANLMGMINSMNNSNISSTLEGSEQKRKMRGPNIGLGDIPDL